MTPGSICSREKANIFLPRSLSDAPMWYTSALSMIRNLSWTPRQACSCTGGLDLEFGTWTDGLSNGATKAYDNYYLANPYLKKLRSGELPVSELDTKVRNVLRLIFRTAMNPDKPFGALCSEAHYAAARKIGGEGIVLLKNDGSVLPIKNAKRILVVGENAVKMMTVGGGSSSLKVEKEISPLDGIRARAAQDGIEVKYVRGYVGDVGGSYNGVTTGQDLSESRSAKELIAEAVKEAANADYVIFVGGLNKSKHQDCEGSDRYSLSLSYGQDEVISALSAANSKLVVALVSGNAVAMPWIAAVPTILQTWYLGSEAGEALADVVFGDADRHEWVAEPGEFTLLLGSASDDIRTSAKFTLK